MNYFQYNDGKGVVSPDHFRISASQLSRFFDDTANWYREFLLNEGPVFTGSTASELGTIVHAAAAMYHDTKTIDYQQILTHIHTINNPDVEKSVLLDQYEPMINTLISYIKNIRITKSEEFLYQELLPRIGVGGSCDAYDSHTGTIYDFKTTSQKSPITSFSRAYWFQLMTYAYLYKQQGKPANYLKLIYVTRNEVNRISEVTGKPMKDYPSQVYTVTHEIKPADFELIESCLKLIAESVALWQSKPEYHHLLAQDYRLKQPAGPRLFKD